MKYILFKTLFRIFFLLSFLYSQEEIDNNASFTFSNGVSPIDAAENIIGIFTSLLGINSEIESKGINFNYKFHSNRRLSYGLCSTYRKVTETFYNDNEDVISEEISRYYAVGPIVYFNWRKGSKILDISTNLGACIIYADRPAGYAKKSILVVPQVDLMSIHLGNKHSLNMNFGFGIQYLWSSIGYTHKF